MRAIFRVVDGELRFVIDGEQHIVRAGSEIIAEPGTVHALQNGHPRLMQFRAAQLLAMDTLRGALILLLLALERGGKPAAFVSPA